MHLEYRSFRIIICDNASQDDSINHIKDWAAGDVDFTELRNNDLRRLLEPPSGKPIEITHLTGDKVFKMKAGSKITLLETGGNLGFAGGNNVGIKYALSDPNCSYVWLLNNDTVVESDTLSRMVCHSSSLSKQGIKNTCGSLVCFYDEPKVIQSLGGGSHNPWTGIGKTSTGRYLRRDTDLDHEKVASELSYIHGCSWLLPRKFFDDVGLMEEQYFLYYEELDWCYRSQGQYTLTYASDAVVYHKEGSAIGSRSYQRGPSTLSDYYMARSRRLFMRKFAPRQLWLVYATLLLQAANRIRQLKFKNSIAILKGTFGLKFVSNVPDKP